MKKEWFFDRFCGDRIAVYTEDGKIVEVCLEDDRSRDVVGNIYKGRVQNVVQGMQAAFVSCGMERNCYLQLDEGAARFSSYDGTSAGKKLALAAGDEVLVQAVKAPRGNKGAKVSCDLSFVGKNLIYLPLTDFLGISRKITEEETRVRLLAEADKLRSSGEGFIVRTAAVNAGKKQLKAEAEYLKRVYRDALETAQTAPVGGLVYRECELPVKLMRDTIAGDVHKVYVGHGERYDEILRCAKTLPDFDVKKLVRYTGERSMFREFGIAEQVDELCGGRVALGNGAYLVIDNTEAMTVIDVNTGGFTGDDSLENTVYEVNLLAAREIARQVRLRNVGGIVAVDFIDMTDESHRNAVCEELERALAFDRAKCRVLPMSDLCVVLFTRKRTNGDIASFFLKPCTHCTRQGQILSDIYIAMRIRGEITDYFANGYRAVIVDMSRTVMNNVLSERYFEEEIRGRWKNKRVYMIPHSTYHEEKFTIRGDNADVLSLPDNAQILY